MRIKNRLSPYPILDNYGDDYVDSYLNAEFDIRTQFSEVYGKIEFDLENDEIKELIKQEKAAYTVHIECPSTCFRKVVSSYEPEVEFRFDTNIIATVIEIRTFIILTEDIYGYSSKKFHPDYQGETFDLSKHQMIAIGPAEDHDVKKDDRDLDSLPSIIRIVKLDDKKKGSLSVNTDNDDCVIVGLDKESFELYAQLGKSAFKSTIFSMVLLPALMVIVQRMYMNKDNDDITSLHWYQVIENLLKNNGFSIENINVENDSLLTVCQAIFADPIAKGFKELEKWSERI